MPARHLTVGLQCGGSDGYSGISANPALGAAVDRLVRHGGAAILSETPEIYGGEHLLTRRAVSREVADKLLARIARVAILLPQMHAIGLDPLGKRYAVIDDKSDVMRGANGLKWFSQSRCLMLIHIFDAKLEGRDWASGQRRLKLVRKISTDFKRRDQI
mgnify:CR=1 FL=1